MGRIAAHLVLVRKSESESNLEVLLQKRSRKVTQGLTHGVPGGSLSKAERVWSCDEALPEESCVAARVRGAVREAAEEAGGGRGPDLVPVSLPEISAGKSTMPEEKVAGARLPASIVDILSSTELPPVIQCKMGDYTHFFVLHMLEGLVAQEWIPRAQAGHRWEIDETASDTKFGYRWVALSEWGPALTSGGQLCSWAKALFHNQRVGFMSAVDSLTGLGCFEKCLKKMLRTEPETPSTPPPPPAPRPKAPEKPTENVEDWLAHAFHGFAQLKNRESKNKLDELAASISCKWLVDYEDVTNPKFVERYASFAPKESLLCFHGTSKWACRQIALEGFDASRRSPALTKIVPYLAGEYLSSDPTVSLKYSRQKEVGFDTLSMLVVEVPANNFEMKNGVWFQHKFGAADEADVGKQLGGVDLGQASTLVIEDERVIVPRAILTFRPSSLIQAKAASAMACYDICVAAEGSLKASGAPCMSGEALPAAVLFDLDMTCWPYTMAIESHGPPYSAMANDVGATDCDGKRLRLCKDVPEIFRILRQAKIPIVLCSRSCVPNWCKEFIDSCPLDPKNDPDLKFGDVIHSASVIRGGLKKIKHLKEIRASLDVPFQQLLFFDDDQRNCDDGRRLGVRCMQVPRNGAGVTMDSFTAGLRLFSSPMPADAEPGAESSAAAASLPAVRTVSDRLKSLCAPRGSTSVPETAKSASLPLLAS